MIREIWEGRGVSKTGLFETGLNAAINRYTLLEVENKTEINLIITKIKISWLRSRSGHHNKQMTSYSVTVTQILGTFRKTLVNLFKIRYLSYDYNTQHLLISR